MRKRRAIALVVVAFAVRLGAIAAFGFERVEFGDARDYLDTASALCATGSYPAQGNLPFFRAPGLPVFIAAVTGCNVENVAAIKIALAIVDSLSVALIAALSFSVFRSPLSATLAGLGAAVWPLFVAGVTDVRTEPLFMFFLVLALFAVRRWPVLAGASLALAALTRPVALVFVPLFLIASGARLRRALLFLIGFALVLGPWTIRNYMRHGELILVNNAGGYSLWRGTHPEMARIYEIRDRDEFRRASLAFEQQITAPATRRFHDSAAWRDAALANIRSDPGLQTRFALKKALLYWRPWLNPQEYSTRVVVLSGVVFITLYALAAWGLVRLAREHRALVLWVLAFFIIGWLAHIPHQVVTRFRYPLTDALLLIAAGHAAILLSYHKELRKS